MGAQYFENVGLGPDLRKAFSKAVEDAQYEHGHGGYTGSLAEKGEVVEITIPADTRMQVTVVKDSKYTTEVVTFPGGRLPTREEAQAYAMLCSENDDKRIHDKWGPAGAIEFDHPQETTGLLTCATCNKSQQVHKVKGKWIYKEHSTSKLGAGRSVWGGYSTVSTPCPSSNQPVPKGSRPSSVRKPQRAFLFFGWASS